MARTFHHGNKAKERHFGICLHWSRYKRPEETPPKRKRWKDEWHWMNTPGWWIKERMTVPQRAEVRQLKQKVMRLVDLEDAPEFPLVKKPHVYYW